MLNKRYPFETIENVFENDMPKLNDNISEIASLFVSNLLNKIPIERLNAETIKLQPYFKDLDWNKLENGQLKPPIKIKVSSPTDVSYFDSKIKSKCINYKDFGAKYPKYEVAKGPSFEEFNFNSQKFIKN